MLSGGADAVVFLIVLVPSVVVSMCISRRVFVANVAAVVSMRIMMSYSWVVIKITYVHLITGMVKPICIVASCS